MDIPGLAYALMILSRPSYLVPATSGIRYSSLICACLIASVTINLAIKAKPNDRRHNKIYNCLLLLAPTSIYPLLFSRWFDIISPFYLHKANIACLFSGGSAGKQSKKDLIVFLISCEFLKVTSNASTAIGSWMASKISGEIFWGATPKSSAGLIFNSFAMLFISKASG